LPIWQDFFVKFECERSTTNMQSELVLNILISVTQYETSSITAL